MAWVHVGCSLRYKRPLCWANRYHGDQMVTMDESLVTCPRCTEDLPPRKAKERVKIAKLQAELERLRNLLI